MNKFWKRIKYPRLLFLILCIVLAYWLFQTVFFKNMAEFLNGRGYFSVFISGFLFAYGFTAPFAVAFLISLAPEVNVWIAALAAGFGALIGDLFIFEFIKVSFQKEFDVMKLSLWYRGFKGFFDRKLNGSVKKYLLWTVAGFLIASPLPDEFGVSILSGFTNINPRVFMVLSFLLNTLGILVILLLAR